MKKRGFSLVEVMIAAGIVAVVVIGGYFLLSDNEAGESYIEEKSEAVEKVEEVKNILQERNETVISEKAKETNSATPGFTVGEVITGGGKVISNEVEASFRDGPAWLRVMQLTGDNSGNEIDVIYTQGDLGCLSRGYSFNIHAGEIITFKGVATSKNAISICTSEDYYISREVVD